MNVFFKIIKYFFLLIVGSFILFAIARGVFCSPDKDVEKVALPSLVPTLYVGMHTRASPQEFRVR